MVDSPENLVLAQIHAIRADLAGADARQQVAIDRMTERLVRIERRLDLREI